MGAGKTVAANELAKRLKRMVFSTDLLIEQKEGKSIAEIFKVNGEDYFRRQEEAVVADLSKKDNLIIDCGGGVFLNPKNRKSLKKNGLTFYLAASPEVVHQRTRNSRQRPLLNTSDPKKVIKDLLAKREQFYKQADHTIDTDGKTNEQVCNEIEEILSHG